MPIRIAARSLLLASALPLCAGAQAIPPVKLAWPTASNLIATGKLRLDVGEEYQLGLTAYGADTSRYADLSEPKHRPRWSVSDPKVASLTETSYPHMVDIKGVGDGTATITAVANGITITLPVVVGRAKALDVAADFPAEHRVGRVKIEGPPSQLGTGTLKLGVGEESQLRVDALFANSGERMHLALYPPTWVSSNPSVLRLKDIRGEAGIATAVGAGNGSATLTVSVQGMKHTIPVRVGTARSLASGAAGTGSTPFAVAAGPIPAVADAEGPVVVRAPEVFGAKTFLLERSTAGAASSFATAATRFRMEQGAIVMADSSAEEGVPLLYRVTAVDQAGRAVPGEVVASAFGASAIAGLRATRGTGGVTLTWTAAPGASYRVARFAPDGGGWKLVDVPAGSATWTDGAAPAGATVRYAVFAVDGERVTAVSATVSPK